MCLHQFRTDVREMKVQGAAALADFYATALGKPKELLHFIIEFCDCRQN